MTGTYGEDHRQESKDISSVLIDTGRTEARAFETVEMRRYHDVMAKLGGCGQVNGIIRTTTVQACPSGHGFSGISVWVG
jgi:hypothetical protein